MVPEAVVREIHRESALVTSVYAVFVPCCPARLCMEAGLAMVARTATLISWGNFWGL